MDATPDNLEKLVNLLRQATANHKPSEEALQQLQSLAGYRICLMHVLRNNGVPPDARLMAAVVLKLSIPAFWATGTRSRATPVETEKAELKTGILHLLREEQHNGIAAQLVLAVAEIARYDFPGHWSSLIPDLLAPLKPAPSSATGGTIAPVGTELQLLRSLAGLDGLLTIFAHATMAKSRVRFQKALSPHVATVCDVWQMLARLLASQCNTLLSGGAPSPSLTEALAKSCELTVLATKCVHRMVLYGVQHPSASKDARDFFTALGPAIQTLLDIRTALSAAADAADSPKKGGVHTGPPSSLCRSIHQPISRITLRLVGIVVRIQKARPLGFRAFLPAFLNGFYQMILAHSSTFDRTTDALTFEKLVSRTLMFFANVITTPQYMKPGEHDDTESIDPRDMALDATVVAEAKGYVDGVFNPKMISELVKLLLLRYFPLSAIDLHHWQSSPEQFALDEDVDFQKSNPTERARPAALHLFMALIHRAPETGCPVVMEALSSLMKQCPPVIAAPAPADVKMVLMKEALYNALCAAPLDLQEYLKKASFNFVQWYETTLRAEVMSTEPSLHFLRRRVLALLGDWAERLPPPMTKAVFSHGVTLLSGTDIVSALSAVTVIHNLIQNLQYEDDDDDDDGDGDDDEEEKSSAGSASSPKKPMFDSPPTVPGVTLTPATIAHLSAASTAARLLMEYGQPICAAIFTLLPKLEALHHREALLEEVIHIMSTLGSYLKYLPPLVEGVMAQLAYWWKACEKDEQTVLRGPILRCVSSMIQTLGTDSVALHSTTLPLLKACLASSADMAVLRRPVLELWSYVIINAPAMTEDLASLMERWMMLMALPIAPKSSPPASPPPSPPSQPTTILSVLVQTGPKRKTSDPLLVEDLSILLQILDSYILLGGEKFLSTAMPAIARLIHGAFVSLMRARHPPASPANSPGSSPGGSPNQRRRQPTVQPPPLPGSSNGSTHHLQVPQSQYGGKPFAAPSTVSDPSDNEGHAALMKTLLTLALLMPTQFPRLFAPTLQAMMGYLLQQTDRLKTEALIFATRKRAGLDRQTSGGSTNGLLDADDFDDASTGVSFFTGKSTADTKDVADEDDGEDNDGDDGKDGDDDDWMDGEDLRPDTDEGRYAHLLARLFAMSSDTMLAFLHQLQPGTGEAKAQAAELTGRLCEAWLTPKYTDALDLTHRKEMAFALCSALATQCPPVLELAPRIIDFTLHIAEEVERSNATRGSKLSTRAIGFGGGSAPTPSAQIATGRGQPGPEAQRRNTILVPLERRFSEQNVINHLARAVQETAKKSVPFQSILSSQVHPEKLAMLMNHRVE